MAHVESADPFPGAARWQSTSSGGGLILPDGCMDLIFTGERIVVAGPDTRAWTGPALTGPVIGLRLPPGVLPALLGVPGESVRDQRVDLADLLGSAPATALADQARRIGADALSQFTFERQDLEIRRAAMWTERLVERIARGIPIDVLARDDGTSERQFRRKCLWRFGYGPATLRRILRLNRALDRCRAGMPLAGAATDAGFADQAHFTRTCTELTGASPAALIAQDAAAYRSTPFPSGSRTVA